MLVFKNKETYDKACVLRDHGMNKAKRYWHDVLGYNYRMTNLQAAIGCAQMERVDEIVQKKLDLANRYNEAFKNLKGIKIHGQKEGTVNTHWLYTILVQPESGFTRDELALKLAKNGIETRPAFYPLHEMPLYSPYQFNASLANSRYISEHGLSLPSYADITNDELNFVIDAVIRLLNK